MFTHRSKDPDAPQGYGPEIMHPLIALGIISTIFRPFTQLSNDLFKLGYIVKEAVKK